MAEYPIAQKKLLVIDAKVERLCEQYEIPSPTPETSAPMNHLDLHKMSEVIERNRAVIRHTLHECHDSLAIINRSVKQAKAAFVW